MWAETDRILRTDFNDAYQKLDAVLGEIGSFFMESGTYVGTGDNTGGPLTFSKTPVLVISVPDAPGGLAQVLALLAEGQLDIEYMYSLFTNQNGNAYMVFRISDEAKFTALLQSHNIPIATSEELGIH